MNQTTFPDIPGETFETHRNPYWENKNNGGYNKGGSSGQSSGKKEWPKRKEEVLDPSIYYPFAVTGNKEAPADVLAKIRKYVTMAVELGYTARTGSDGEIEKEADSAAREDKRERILPWRDFDEKESKFTWNSERAFYVAKLCHPTFDNMKKGVQHILAKNARLIMGHTMTSRAMFLLCWTEDGARNASECTGRTGFSGHTIKVATAAGVPVFNLGHPDGEAALNDFLNKHQPPKES